LEVCFIHEETKSQGGQKGPSGRSPDIFGKLEFSCVTIGRLLHLGLKYLFYKAKRLVRNK
jgi:hypothetical protein